jgi:hypothetical protein
MTGLPAEKQFRFGLRGNTAHIQFVIFAGLNKVEGEAPIFSCPFPAAASSGPSLPYLAALMTNETLLAAACYGISQDEFEGIYNRWADSKGEHTTR